MITKFVRIKVPVLNKDQEGKITFSFVDVIVDIGLAMLLGTIFINIAFETFFATATTGWDQTTILIWKAVPWAVLAACITAFLRYARNPSTF